MKTIPKNPTTTSVKSTPLQIIPAIDLLDGQCVRLHQGDYEQKTIYDQDPVDQLKAFADSGCERIHIVDLSAAKNPEDRQWSLIEKLATACGLKIQTGGGLRKKSDCERLYNLGVDQVVVGTMACTQTEETLSLMEAHPQTILATDLFIEGDQKWIATHGWQKKQGLTLEAFLDIYPMARFFLCTDISKDGALSGPNFQLYQELANKYPDAHWMASGGVSALGDLRQLKADGAASSVVVGKALYENRFTLREALQC